jgi:hypothetical protein
MMDVSENAQVKTVAELEAMPMDERIAYFAAQPIPDLDPRIDPAFVARSRAKAVDTIARRDREQAEQRHAL